jgi:hypothetical protein
MTVGQELCLEVGGARLRFVARSEGLALAAVGDHEAFLVPPGTPTAPFDAGEVTIEVHREAIAPARPAAVRFDAGRTWTMESDEEGLRFLFYADQLGRVPYRELRLAPDLQRARLTLLPSAFPAGSPVNVFEFPLDELLLVHLLGARGDGIELHACGLVDAAGRGLLFAGHSGHGKTTTARLWHGRPGVTVLSDDRIVLRRAGDEIRMYGTPWHGDAELAEPRSARLDLIAILQHGEANRLLPMAPVEAVAELMARAFLPYHDRSALENTAAFLAEVIAQVSCRRFPFLPSPESVDWLREHAA